MSRHHIEIRQEGAGWTAVDLGSRNGTLLNGKKLRGRAPVKPGDEVVLGDNVILLETEEAAEDGAVEDDRQTDGVNIVGPGRGVREEISVLVGESAGIQAVRRAIDKIAKSASTVLITGESGTGKEIAAKLIHRLSPRAHRPFVVVNCPALPASMVEAELFGVERGAATDVAPRPGRFETAHGGTLFLDEIGDMELGIQAKLLRVLEEKRIERIGGRAPIPVDVRILAATHHDLKADVERGPFRLDLYHRLNTVRLQLPALRERRDDIPLLMAHFLSVVNRPGLEFSPDAMAWIKTHPFPGNVRELRRLVEHVALFAEGAVVGVEDLPEEFRRDAASDAATLTVDLDPAELLYRRVVLERESFWSAVRDAFLRREVSPEAVRRLVARAFKESGGSYKEMARLFHIEADHRRLLNFLGRHGLRVRD